ncbi:hypothetical protein FRB96_002072 [Tulasnella sp. 330]|nr:hypothetical protein FRB96_002072 [Tulasnella sp. 330]KAG8887663.1 hypothetical protein FRB98_009225 [Tulasnella sp. 332]
MSTDTSATIGARRMGNKAPPKLPLSVFTAKSSVGPLSADPTTVFPASIVDANVGIPLEEWKLTAGDLLKIPITGVVVDSKAQHVEGKDLSDIPTSVDGIAIAAIITPTHLADRGISKLPAHVTSANLPISLSISFSNTPGLVEDIRMALSAGHVVDLDVPWDAAQAESDKEWDSLVDILGKAVEGLPEDTKAKPIVLGNLLPPPHSLSVPIVKLLRHPTYQAYQAYISQLSFIPNTYLKFLPPSWKDPTPPSPGPGAMFSSTPEQGAKNDLNKEEWKRRVKMYLGPALDAFGFSRIIFGSSPSPSSTSPSTPHDWYVLVREVVAELAVDQEGMNAIFCKNAKLVYGP